MKWKRCKAVLSVALCLGLAGCGLTDVVDNEIRSDYVVKEGAVICPDSVNPVKKSADVETILEDFELALENDYLELYIGKDYDIAVYEKASGKLTMSNAAYHEMDAAAQNSLSAEAKRVVFSQVAVEYYTSALTKMSMSSYPDAYSSDKNQVTWEVADDTLKVTYGIGTSLEESPLIQVFTKETYEGYLEQLEGMREAGTISMITYRNLANNYTEYTYENMSSSDQRRYKELYPKIEELGTIYIVKNTLTAKITNSILEVYTLLGIDETVKAAEQEKLGENAANVKPAYFKIPVCYRLSGGDLLVSLDLRNIEVGEGYHLTKVELMKCFGASTEKEDGYIFYPDGSGAIIENDIDSNSMNKVMVPFYGEDQAVMLTEGTSDSIKSTFPVFGIKTDDHAFFAIVENGAAVGGMTAQVRSSYLNYNIAYPYFNYSIVDDFGIQGVALAFYQNVADVDCTVRYHFLNGEEADYNGMAQYYQQYLVNTGSLVKRESNDTSWGLDVEMIGSIQKIINNFGIPIDSDFNITTFEQAQEIMDILHEDGIADVDVIYSGMANGGMEQMALNRFKVQKGLGGLKGYQELEANLTSQGDTLYMGLDPAGIYERGNGIRKTEDVSKYLTKVSVVVGEEQIIPGVSSDYASADWLINPLRYKTVMANFIDAHAKTGSKKLYLESFGAYLNGNYSAKEGVTRQTAQILVTQALEQLVNAGYALKLDVGNDYALRYADSLVNVPTTSSHQRMESYSIPFVGMVLKGYVPFTCKSINQSPNADIAVLRAVESGAGLNYLLIYDNQLNLMDTNYESLFSVNYKTQIEKILEDYRKLNQEMGYLQNVRIVDHEHLTEDVNCVTYEDGTKIYVNYGKEAYETSEGTVEALAWLVVGR